MTSETKPTRPAAFLSVELWTWLYVVASPFVGAALVLTAVGMTQGGGDYCDRSYTSIAERDADFRQAQIVGTIGCVVMIVVGLVLVAVLVRRRRGPARHRTVRVIAAISGAVIAIAGFALIAVVGLDFSSDCGW